MDITPRWILQYWGTDVCRNHFHNDIWVASVEYKLLNSKEDIVIDINPILKYSNSLPTEDQIIEKAKKLNDFISNK